jgi:glycosyltransferase involved in cell wall biosynthesis
MRKITIIIPTLNNMDYVIPCIRSIAANTVEHYKMVVVNQGARELQKYLVGDIQILHSEKNLGWAGAINYALDNIEETEYVMLMNDDTLILNHDYDWLTNMRLLMDNDESIAAVGPTSNCVAGLQQFALRWLPPFIETKFLIGFCAMLKKSYFDQIGRMDESLTGGDDLDWSMRFRKAGHKLIIRRDIFVYHYGFVTGEKIYGDRSKKGGWNSPEMSEQTNIQLIRKHGFKAFIETIRNQPVAYDIEREEYGDDNCLMNIVKGKGIDVGCGSNKITPETIGIDLIAKDEILGEFGGGWEDEKSTADIKASGDNLHMFSDNELDYVVARHNLEHYANPIKTLREWNRVLRPDGKLGITMPDDTRVSGIRLDPTHKHSFNREGLKDMLELIGFHVDEIGGSTNRYDFYIKARKNGQSNISV